jgi:hypothetical protein
MSARWGRSRLGRRGAKLNTCVQSGHQSSPPRRLGLFSPCELALARGVIGGRAGFGRAGARQYRHSRRKFCLDAGGVVSVFLAASERCAHAMAPSELASLLAP